MQRTMKGGTTANYKVEFSDDQGRNWKVSPGKRDWLKRNPNASLSNLVIRIEETRVYSYRLYRIKRADGLVVWIDPRAKEEVKDTATYELWWRRLDRPKWKEWRHFNEDKGNKRQFTHSEAIERCKRTAFTPASEVRVWRDGWLILDQHMTTGKLVAWMETKAPSAQPIPARDATSTHVTRKENGNVNISKPLNVPRKTIIKKIQEHLKQHRADYDERLARAKEAQARRAEVWQKFLDAELNRVINDTCITNELVAKVLDSTYSLEQALDVLRERVSEVPGILPFLKDEAAEKMLSVLEAATDTNIEITADSSLYRYL